MLADNPIVPLYYGSKTEVFGTVGGYLAQPIWGWDMTNYWKHGSGTSSAGGGRVAASSSQRRPARTARPASPPARPAPGGAAAVIEVDDLTVDFPARDGGTAEVVRDVSFAIRPGERVGLVGESGSGKSVTAQAVMRLIPPPGGSSAA